MLVVFYWSADQGMSSHSQFMHPPSCVDDANEECGCSFLATPQSRGPIFKKS